MSISLMVTILIYFRSCLEHIVNLGTQQFLSTYSKSKYYDPEHPSTELHVENAATKRRDVIGLIRATAVKVSSHTREPGRLCSE